MKIDPEYLVSAVMAVITTFTIMAKASKETFDALFRASEHIAAPPFNGPVTGAVVITGILFVLFLIPASLIVELWNLIL